MHDFLLFIMETLKALPNDFTFVPFLFIMDLIGTIVFAISGALAAREHKMDIFGMFIIASVTGMGGGTLRDMMIGSTPVFWMKQPIYMVMIAIGASLTFIFREKMLYLRKSLLLFDTIGLGVFTIIGIHKGLAFGLHPAIAIGLGAVTGCFGGAIRDILCNEVPAILHREIYATPCLVGGIVFVLLRSANFENNWVDILTVAVIIVIRLLAVKYHWQLPKIE